MICWSTPRGIAKGVNKMNNQNVSRKYTLVLLISIGVAGFAFVLSHSQALQDKLHLRTTLRSSTGAASYSPNIFVGVLNSMDERGELKNIHDLAGHSSSGRAVVVFFSSVSTSCPSGKLLSILKNSAEQGQQVGYTILLPGTFSQSDVLNLKTNLRVSIPVELADPLVTREWLTLDQRYGAEVVNGTVILVDDKKVLSVVQGIEETTTFLEELN